VALGSVRRLRGDGLAEAIAPTPTHCLEGDRYTAISPGSYDAVFPSFAWRAGAEIKPLPTTAEFWMTIAPMKSAGGRRTSCLITDLWLKGAQRIGHGSGPMCCYLRRTYSLHRVDILEQPFVDTRGTFSAVAADCARRRARTFTGEEALNSPSASLLAWSSLAIRPLTQSNSGSGYYR